MKMNKLALISILVVLGVVLLVAIFNIPHFLDKIPKGSSLRGTIISIAKVANSVTLGAAVTTIFFSGEGLWINSLP